MRKIFDFIILYLLCWGPCFCHHNIIIQSQIYFLLLATVQFVLAKCPMYDTELKKLSLLHGTSCHIECAHTMMQQEQE